MSGTADANAAAGAAPALAAPGETREVIAELIDAERFYQMGATTVRALNGVSIRIHKGEYVAIMGRSGSGKSTLLNLLGCLDRPTGGEYVLGEQPVSKLTDDDLSRVRGETIGFIFQSFNLIPQLTVLENLEVPLFYSTGVGPESRRKAEHLARRVGLEGRLDHKPMELSGGQQQRVAIARALMNDPLFLLADEATGNLDSSTEQEILEVIDELHTEGVTIVLVTHNPKVADHAERTVWLKDGEVEEVVFNRGQDGSPPRRLPGGDAANGSGSAADDTSEDGR